MESLGSVGQDFGDERGRITLASPARSIIIVRMSGHAPGAVMSSVIEAIDGLAGRDAPTDYFYDLWDMETYATEVRVSLTNYHLKHRALLRSLHACTRSRVVKMGIAVAHLALRVIEQHESRVTFDAALDRMTNRSARAPRP